MPSSFTDQATCDAPGWGGEEALDVEAVHGMAPDANVKYYASKSCFDADFLDTLEEGRDGQQGVDREQLVG